MFTVSGTINIRLRKTDLTVDSDDAALVWLDEQILAAHKTMAERLCALGFSVESSGTTLSYETAKGVTHG